MARTKAEYLREAMKSARLAHDTMRDIDKWPDWNWKRQCFKSYNVFKESERFWLKRAFTVGRD